MFYDLENKKIKNSGDNWVAPTATIIGDVTLKKIQVFGLMLS
jgi:carbonic anhydrase/acetyltransferase-like protein (isoleucine patch superfamily)